MCFDAFRDASRLRDALKHYPSARNLPQ